MDKDLLVGFVALTALVVLVASSINYVSTPVIVSAPMLPESASVRPHTPAIPGTATPAPAPAPHAASDARPNAAK